MWAKHINIQKLLILNELWRKGTLGTSDVVHLLNIAAIEDAEVNGVKGTLRQLEQEKFVVSEEGKFTVSDIGKKYLLDEIENLKGILDLLSGCYKSINANKISDSIIEDLEKVVGIKTIPYDAQKVITQSGSEEGFFEEKNHKKYTFDGERGLGKTLFSGRTHEYDYSHHLALFMSNGIIRFIGFIDSYSHTKKMIFLNDTLELSKPISVFDIRNKVRENFNQSQQKQGFYGTEVKKFVELIKSHL
ncbi:MAG: hypothetical protein Q4B89_08035 [Lachnospiraceae bacterium]|nr:hypothetical protein [Lachnospiraceae bacterium]